MTDTPPQPDTRCPLGARSLRPCGGPTTPDGHRLLGTIRDRLLLAVSEAGCAHHVAEVLTVWDPGDEPAVVAATPGPAGETFVAATLRAADALHTTMYTLGIDTEWAEHGVTVLTVRQWENALADTPTPD